MNNKTLPYWLALEESKPVRFSELAHLMAKAMHPGDHELMSYAAARINLETELKQTVKDGALTVRNAAGLGRHTFAHGDALQRAVMLPQDLRPFLAERGIELRLTPHGNGPDLWTLENAAAAIAEQEQWHDGARGSLESALLEAASSRALVVRNPHTDLPKTDGDVRAFYELVTPSDVNAWLEKQGAPYRWSVARPEVKPEPQAAMPAPVADSASNTPVVKTKAKRRTWWDVSSPYIVDVMRAGQYATCKELYRALEAKAGPDSPFDKGTGVNRGSLFVREIARALDVKTVQNKWQTLRELAQK